MKIFTLFFGVFLTLASFAQQNPDAAISSRIIHESAELFSAEYALSGEIHFNQMNHDNILYQIPIIHGTGFLQYKGRPALPSFTILLADYSSDIEITFTSIQSDTIKNIIIYPWIGMPVDLVGTPSPEFIIDNDFYGSDSEYPENQARLVTSQKYRGQKISMIQICPMTYNPAEKMLIIHRLFRLDVTGDALLAEKMQQVVQPELKNTLTNTAFYQSRTSGRSMDEAINYLIITSTDYSEAAINIAEWREQTGYETEILAQASWTSAQIFQTILQKYYGNHPPEYVLLLGDHNKVPGIQYISDIGMFPTDRMYAYMDGGDDYFPDLAIGRISVTNPQQALTVVNKIIQYEKNPVTLSSFYNTSLAAAYFQDDNSDDYADRRFAQTAEEILQYLTNSIGKTVTRAYYTGSTKTPLYWNNGYYSNGEPVPNYLRKPTFPWDGDANDIRNQINAGTFFVYHRDHGYETGWGDPAFNNTNVASLTNGNRLPVVSSVNCQTGKFLVSECFSEAFLRHANGGAVGVFGHAEVSYSGYNDALSMGLVDAIFATPGLVPNFTGSGHISGTITPHDQILKMGDAVNQADLSMTQTWGDPWGLEEYQFNLFHYFGDPAMRIFTQEPLTITASHQNTIFCQDSTFSINSCNIPDALATLTADGQLIGLVTLSGGTGTISFTPTASNMLILTISAPNSVPYISSISNSGNCVIADFSITEPEQPCAGSAVQFTNESSGYYTELLWDFGIHGSPQFTSGQGPHQVFFSQGGWQNISLIAISPIGNDTNITQVWIDSVCTNVMPPTGYQEIIACSGILKDNGNDMPYLSGSDCETVISSPGASQITINFNLFDIQPSTGCSQAYLRIISGTSGSGTIIGTYCNTNAPMGPINIPNETVTILFYAPTNAGYDGFELTWDCIQPALPPVALFQTGTIDPCGSIIQFSDMSMHQPFQWQWDFGDGNTSALQNPVHEYVASGIYNVKLIVTNPYGSDTLIQNNLLTINVSASLNDTLITVCEPQTVSIPGGNGQNVFWYDSQTSLTPFTYTDTLVFAASTGQSTFYCRDYGYGASAFGGKLNNSGTGAYFNSSTVHHLGFDVYQPLILKTVNVYAQDNGNRTFTLKNGNDEVVYTSTHYLTTGLNTVTLDYVLMPDNDYKLGAGQYCKLFRNGDTSGPDFYPLEIPGLLSINRSSAGYPNAAKYYYFFYNWQVQPICPGPPSVKEVIVHVSDTTIEAWPATSLCLADSIILSGSLTGAYTWQPGNIFADFLVVHQAGTYYADISTNGCNSTSNIITIEGELYPDADFIYSINGAEVTFTNQSTGTSWYWDFGDGTTSTDENPVHTYAGSGTYNVTLIVQNSCGTDTLVQQVNITFVGLPDLSNDQLFVYPNPADDVITIVLPQPGIETTIRVYNTAGQCIISKYLQDNKSTIFLDIAELPAGLYMLIIQTSTGQFNGKFFKE
jgi:PKD repeat protein